MDGMTASILIIALRIVVPVTILRWPLAGIFLAIAADASDVMVLQATGWGVFEGGGTIYSYFDKSLDLWYLLFAWFATRKYWTQHLARRTASVLFFWRAVGVLTFFIWPHRILFLLAPAIFENFYILWTVIRKWWPQFILNGKRLAIIITIAAVPKLIQEAMMHWIFEDQTWDFLRTRVFWWLYS